MAKIKLSRLHKYKIHKNRWLAWAISYGVIVFIAMMGYIAVSEVNFETQIAAENSFQSWHNYSNAKLGFSVRFPADWAIDPSTSGSIDFVPQDLSQPGVTISVLNPSAEKVLRKQMHISAEKPITVDQVPGKQLTNRISKTAVETVVLVVHAKKLYDISGPSDLVSKFILTFRFIK